MLALLRNRLHREEQGFTLIELLVVIIILGILVAIAVPSYLAFRGRATNAGAQADLRTIAPVIESYYSDNGTYVGMTIAGLKASYDQSIVTANYSLGTVAPGAATYCIQSTVNGTTYDKAGPAAAITAAACP